MKNTLSVVAGIVYVIAFIPYIRAILKGQTKPAKASWLIWAALDSITLAGMNAKHVVSGPIVVAASGAWIIVLLALKYGASGWTKLDKFCLDGAVVGIALWQIFDSPVLGIMTSLSVMFIAAIPTFVSAWRDPNKEDRTAWTMFWLSCLVVLPSIFDWTLASAAQPITFIVIQSVMMYLVWLHPHHNADAAGQ